jgi:hypothetical protein
MAQLSNAQMNLGREMQSADQRISTAQAEVYQANTILDGKRGELQRIRAAAFDCF